VPDRVPEAALPTAIRPLHLLDLFKHIFPACSLFCLDAQGCR
jgi:hypothetical protein